jgi:WD40 repeat protein
VARIVCQVLHRPGRVTFIWSDGSAHFEPYHLEGAALEEFQEAARQARALVEAGGADLYTLASVGHQLYHRLFSRDDPRAAAAHAWWTSLRKSNSIRSVEIASDSPGAVPWNVVYEGDPQRARVEDFWGIALPLTVGRRVHPLRIFPFLEQPSVLAAGLNEMQKSGDSAGSADDLLRRVRAQVPDVLVLSGRASQGRLAGGSLGLIELRDAVAAAQAGSPHPLLVLVPDAEQPADAWQALVDDARLLFASVIAPQTPAGGSFADVFLSGLLSDKLPVGDAMRQARQRAGAEGLAWDASCPPYLQVLREGEEPPAALPQPKLVPLPEAPYRPLAAFDREDRGLFTGREDDVARCVRLFDEAGTRTLLVHGYAGVGKASFLRAGLLPTLDEESVGYLALRDRSDSQPQAELDRPTLALRPGGDLAGQLAEAIAAFCRQPFTYTTPAGKPVTVDLPALLARRGDAAPPSEAIKAADERVTAVTAGAAHPAGASTGVTASPSELWQRWCDEPTAFAELLDRITRDLPYELVITVEQAEDLVTQAGDDDGHERRRVALDMLAALAEGPARCKVVLSARAEFVGPLTQLWPARAGNGLREFYLRPLTSPQIVEALLLPTATEPPLYASATPHQKYKFAFEAGVVQQIVDESVELAKDLRIDPLPYAQAACAYLYTRAKQRDEELIRTEHLSDLASAKKGKIDQALSRLVDQRLAASGLPRGSQRRVRDLFAKLYERHEGGVVTRKLVATAELHKLWRGAGPVEEAVNAGSSPAAGLLDVQQLLVGGEEKVYVSLAHESLAAVGLQASADKKRDAAARTQLIDALFIIVPLAILGMALTYYLTRNYVRGAGGAEDEDAKTQFIAKLQTEAQLLNQPLYTGALGRADQALRAGNVLRARQLLLSQQPNSEDKKSDLRGFDWLHLWRQVNRQRRELHGHQGLANALATSPDGKLLASAGADGAVRVWNLARQGEVAAIFAVKKDDAVVSLPTSVAFAPDGKQLAAGDAKGVIRVWDVQVGDEAPVENDTPAKTLTGHDKAVTRLVFTKDALVSAGADKKALVWDLAKGEPRATFAEHTAAVEALSVSLDGKLVATGDAGGTILVWDITAKKAKQTLKTPGPVADVAFSTDGKLLASAGDETDLGTGIGVLRLWNVESGSELHRAVHGGGLFAVAFQPKSQVVVTAGKDHTIRAWDAKTGKETLAIPGHFGWVRSLAFTPNGATLATSSHDNTIKLWDWAELTRNDVLDGHKDGTLAIAFSPDNRIMVSGGRDGVVKFWDAAAGTVLGQWEAKQPVTALAFAPDEKQMQLAVGMWSDADNLKLLDVQYELRQLLHKELHNLKGHAQSVTALAYSKAGVLASGSGDGTTILWDGAAGKTRHVLKGERGVSAVAFSPGGASLATGDVAGRVKLWDAATGKPLPRKAPDMGVHEGPVTGLAFVHEDFAFVSAGADHTIKLWTWKQDEGADARRVFRSHHQPISGLAWLGSGQFATASWDRTVKLWDIREWSIGDERFTFAGHTSPVRCLAVSPNRQILASGAADGAIRLWRAAAPVK